MMKLCKNTDCSDKKSDDNEKCNICDGLNDILFIEESPNNRKHLCDLCKKDKNIVQMKNSGEYICKNACDE
jgi:hypothetical protein